ncbi:MAG: hypothetical protein HZC54_10060 [Verrucomicrobia bacterium]|nr:hypothetical protein [Verrucomicrobiota bacterium]
MNGSSNQATVLHLPDPAICRASRVTKGVADCLVEKSFLCSYALSYGNNTLCMYPLVERIIANTLAEKSDAQPTRPNPSIASSSVPGRGMACRETLCSL